MASWLAPTLLLGIFLGVAGAPVQATRIRVALCQIEVGSQPVENLRRIEAALVEAAALKADLVCFPEASLFGWLNPAAHAGAEPIPGSTTDRLGALAKKHGVMVSIGIEEKEIDRLFNSVVLIDSDGRLLLRHRKVNVLANLMDPPYTPGLATQRSVVETRFGRIGLMICADTFQEPLVNALADQKPDLVLVPYGWAAPTDAWPKHGESLKAWVVNTARKCNSPVVGVDSVGEIQFGPWKGFQLGGQSVLSDAKGEAIDVLPDRVATVRVHEIVLGGA